MKKTSVNEKINRSWRISAAVLLVLSAAMFLQGCKKVSPLAFFKGIGNHLIHAEAADVESISEDKTEKTQETLPEETTTQAAPEVEYVVRNLSYYGISLDGLTEEEALTVIQVVNEKIAKMDFVVSASDNSNFRKSFSGSELGLTVSDETIIDFLDPYIYRKDKPTRDEVYPLTILDLCDWSLYTEKIGSLQEDWSVPAENASFTYENGRIVILSEDIPGIRYDRKTALEKFEKILTSDGIMNLRTAEIQLTAEAKSADLTAEMIRTYSVIGSYTTYFAPPADKVANNRVQNLITSTTYMNGQIFAPGEIISALKMYRTVNAENGYLPAGTFSAGEHIVEYGGGICQTTTTLYNAVLLAELDVVYRSNHSMLVNYVPASMDAMVYSQNGSDFKFRNSSTSYILLNSYVDTENFTLTVNIIGHEDHAADHMVRYETEILDYCLPEVKIVENLEPGIGWENVEQKVAISGEAGPSCEIWSRLWKVTMDNGVETRTLVNAKDHYKPGVATMSVSPDSQAVLTFCDDYRSCYALITACFVDGTPLWADPATWTEEELTSFNSCMQEALEEKGYEWPYSGAEFK